MGEILDLSGGGMRVLTRFLAPAAGEVVRAVIEGVDGAFDVRGRVMWVRKAGLVRREVGVMFEGVSAEAAAALATLARAAAHNESIRPHIEAARVA